MSYYHISGYIIDLSGIPEHMVWGRFNEFVCREASPQISITAMSERLEDLYRVPDGAERLVNDPIHMTYRYCGSTHFFHTPDDVVSYVKVNDDYSECLFNIEPGYYAPHADSEVQAQINNEVMLDVRRILTGRLALDRGLCVHSCVIDYNGNGILFSAVSETGKSTHAHLWQEVFPGTEIVNGDNGFCRVLDSRLIVFGAPWCGDSNEYMNKSIPIKAIVFLEQAQENRIEKLGALDAFIRLSARCFMPFWDKELVNKAMDTVEYMTQNVSCYLLRCLPDHDAVKVVAHEIFGDRLL